MATDTASPPQDLTHGLISGTRYLPTQGLRHNAAKGATALHDLGVWQGDRVALLLRNDFAFFEATAAASLLGAATVPLNWHMTAEEIDYVLEDCDAKVLVAHADLLTEAVLAVNTGRTIVCVATPPEIASSYKIPAATHRCAGLPEWTTWIEGFAPWERDPRPVTGPMFYTSGTTGKPKGVQRLPIGPEAIKGVMARSAAAFGLGGDGIRSVMTGPLYHSAPNAYGMQIVGEGGLLVLQPRFDPSELLALIERHKITNLHMVPTMFVRLLALSEEDKNRYDLSSLKHVVHGAAPCPADVKRAMIDWWGPVINEYYAMTETGFIACSSSEDWLAHPGSVGKAALGVTLEIRREDGSLADPGEPGEICVHSEVTGHVAYHKAQDKTDALRQGDFVRTGDIGYINDASYLFISDRKSDMIISGGVNIYPAEIEQALASMPGVRDSAVFGIPHPDFGERVVAIVESEDGLSPEDITAYLKERISRYKIPRAVYFEENLPREDSGKIKKHKLKAALLEHLPA